MDTAVGFFRMRGVALTPPAKQGAENGRYLARDKRNLADFSLELGTVDFTFCRITPVGLLRAPE
jgi:hypothetical protein